MRCSRPKPNAQVASYVLKPTFMLVVVLPNERVGRALDRMLHASVDLCLEGLEALTLAPIRHVGHDVLVQRFADWVEGKRTSLVLRFRADVRPSNRVENVGSEPRERKQAAGCRIYGGKKRWLVKASYKP